MPARDPYSTNWQQDSKLRQYGPPALAVTASGAGLIRALRNPDTRAMLVKHAPKFGIAGVVAAGAVAAYAYFAGDKTGDGTEEDEEEYGKIAA
ncbi:hypothetical protein ABW19_dt0204758 [Dactylella cylindrospora]|nr:hypothetical protein ABW19_dt0204758 [Dactylella cylindrospora]